MPLPYDTPESAWRFIILMYRLQAAAGPTLEIGARQSVNTTRVKLFRGRAHLLASSHEDFLPYQPAATFTVLQTTPSKIILAARREFLPAMADMRATTFGTVLSFLHKAIAERQKITLTNFGQLSKPSTAALDEYLRALGRRALVTQTAVYLQ